MNKSHEPPTLMETPNSPQSPAWQGCHPSQCDCCRDLRDNTGVGGAGQPGLTPVHSAAPLQPEQLSTAGTRLVAVLSVARALLGLQLVALPAGSPRPTSEPRCPAPQLLVPRLLCHRPLSGAPPSALLPDQLRRGAAGGLVCSPLLPPTLPQVSAHRHHHSCSVHGDWCLDVAFSELMQGPPVSISAWIWPVHPGCSHRGSW